MPVHFDRYEAEATEDWPIRDGSNAHRILTFLLDHPDAGFSPGEIAQATDVPRGSVGPTLQRLERRDLVRHKEPYWAAAKDDRIAAYEGMLLGLAAVADRSDDDGWADVDPSDHEVSSERLLEWRTGG